MPMVELRYQQHFAQLATVFSAIRYGLNALQGHEERLRERVKDSPEVAEGIRKIKDGVTKIGQSFKPKVTLSDTQAQELEEQLHQLLDSLVASEPARELLLNLGLVMLCTQLEVFIGHLIDVTLATEPRLFLQLAPDKELKAKEILELADHEAVMRRLRDKVADEVDRAGTRDKFIKHLGERFGLIEESQIKVAPRFEGPSADGFKDWNLDRVVSLFDERHRVVHRREFPVQDISYLRDAYLIFVAVETVLSVNAVRKYNVRLDGPGSASLALAFGKHFCGIPDCHLEEFNEKVTKMFRTTTEARP